MSHSTIDAEVHDLPAQKPRDVRALILTPIRALASLKLTVVLFSLSLVLVFVGTLAMREAGMWTVVKAYFRSFYVWVPFQVFVSFGQVFLNVPEGVTAKGGFPFPGGLTIGLALFINLLSAHLVRFKFTWKRSGILILHTGLGLLLIGEFITGVFAVESQMRIGQGETANFTERTHELELLLTKSAGKDGDEVVAVPNSKLRRGGTIKDDALPFDIEVVKYMVNSKLAELPSIAGKNPATAGFGLRTGVVEQPEVAGVSTKQDIDTPSAYITLRKKLGGESLGTYLVSFWLRPQSIDVNGKKYQVELRLRRDYKPYSLSLLEFRFDRYIGTEVAKNYSSRLRFVDPERGEDREILIRMNEPFRYQGETFYQADFDKGTEKGTVLQVVRNPGWLIPYISCVLVTIGMLVHFGISLVNYLTREVGR